MLYKEDWEISKSRLKALWEGEIIDRLCISVMSPKQGSNSFHYKVPEKYEDIEKYWTDPELIYKRNIHRMESTYFGGDALPMISLNLGPSSLAAYFGSKAIFTDNSVWFDQCIFDWDKDPIKFDPQSELLCITKEIASYLIQEGKGKFFVSMPDNTSAIDALSHMRSPDNIMEDLVLNPNNVKQAVRTITKAWLDTNDEFFDILIPYNDGGSCIGWLNTWAPGRHAQLQCDLSVMISSEFFEEFVMDELKQACDTMDYPLYHFDGIEQIRHLDMLLSLDKLAMIQWTSVVAQPPPMRSIPTLKKIQSAGKGLLLNVPPEYAEELMSNLSPKGLYIVTETKTEDEAKHFVKLAEKYSLSK
jgi:hypothetical protein